MCLARKSDRREQQEDVEIFNLETGWSVEAVGDNLPPGQDPLSEDGWGVDLGEGSEDDNGWQSADIGDDDDADIWQLAASTSTPSGGTQRSPGSGAVSIAAGKDGSKALASIPRHVLRELERQQREADEEATRLKPSERKKAAARQKTHQRLRIIAGTAAGQRLFSPQGDQTRPMMEMVRGAVFNMISSMYGCQAQLPEESRWLDLFAGTGAIGIEALSRGCGQCHFVELSPWVVSNCLMPNLENCEVESSAVVHTMRAEEFLQKALKLSRFAGGAFDFISVCPPYLLVSYEELYDLLEGSPLLHEESIVIVEYPKRSAHLIRDTLGPLTKLRDRRYGRTLIAVYGPAQE